MLEIFNNEWVVGIGGGILSGLVVTFITSKIFSKRENREYIQNVTAANREIIYALRPGISEGYIPSEEVLSSLVTATARKYSINRSDAFTPKQIAEELIKEILDSSFISTSVKNQYCDTLSHLVKEPAQEAEDTEFLRELRVIEAGYRSRMTRTMSMMLGFVTSGVSMFMVMQQFFDDRLSSPLSSIINIVIPASVVLAATLVYMFTILSAKAIKRKNNPEQYRYEFEFENKLNKDS
jgi:hypothetical protein